MIRSFLVVFALLSLLVAPAPAAAAPTGADEWSAQFCTYEYRPVCGRTRFGRLRTYPNACVARNARAWIIHRGPCRRPR